MQCSLSRTTAELEDDKLLTAQVRAGVAIGNLAHAFDTLWHTHLLVEYGTVCREIHPTDVVRGVRDIGYLYPRMAFSVFINQTVLIVCHHLIQLDAGIHLCQHR